MPVAWRLFLSCQYIVQFSCSAIKLLLSFSFVKLCLAWFAKAFGPTFCKSLFSTLWLGWWAFKWLLFGINFPLEAVSTQMGALVDPSSFVYFEPRTGKHTVGKYTKKSHLQPSQISSNYSEIILNFSKVTNCKEINTSC